MPAATKAGAMIRQTICVSKPAFLYGFECSKRRPAYPVGSGILVYVPLVDQFAHWWVWEHVTISRRMSDKCIADKCKETYLLLPINSPSLEQSSMSRSCIGFPGPDWRLGVLQTKRGRRRSLVRTGNIRRSSSLLDTVRSPQCRPGQDLERPWSMTVDALVAEEVLDKWEWCFRLNFKAQVSRSPGINWCIVRYRRVCGRLYIA